MTAAKSGFKFKFFTVLLFALLATLAVSLIAYDSVSKLVTSLHEESRPNRNLVLLNEIMSDISDAESSVRTYVITRDASYLQPYRDAVASIEEKSQELAGLNSDAGQKARLDSIDNLIQQKYALLNELLSLRKDDEVDNVLQEIIKKIEVQEDSAATQSGKQKLSRMKELFRSKKAKGTEVTAAAELAELQKMVEKMKLEEAEKAEAIMQREFELTKADAEIMNNIRLMMEEIETFEEASARMRAKKAERLADYATAIITIISVSAFLLVLSLAYLVLSFMNRTARYNKEIMEAKERTEKLAQAKEAFLATMSHEIRTPMHAILGFSEQLEKTQLDAKQKSYTATMRDSIEHLLTVVNDILDHTKLDSGKFTFEKTGFRPDEIINSVLTSFKKIAQEKKLQLHFHADENLPRILVGDPHRLKQILYNLAGNAIKFTAEGNVKITAKCFTRENNRVELKIDVADTGIGISPDKINNVFADFYQSEAGTTRKYGGTGLGLAITKKLVELQQGKISVTSQLEKGSVFSFTIPYFIGKKVDIEEKVAVPSNPATVLGTLSVLAADDESYNRMLLETILRRWGMQITVCENGKQAFDAMQKQDYDIILMDVRMPEMDGLEATKKIRSELSGGKAVVPILALTAAGNEKDIRNCKAAGMNDFLSKPFREAELFEKMSGILKIDIDFAQTETRENITEVNRAAHAAGYDLSELKRLSNGDEKFVKEMVSVFIENTEDGIVKIKQAIENQDWEKAGLLAHRLAAPSRHLRMKSIVKKLKEIEHSAQHASAAEIIPRVFAALEEEVKYALEQLKQEENF